LAQICTKSFVGWGFAPDPTGNLTALPLAGLGGGAPGKGKEGRGKGRRGAEGGRGREGTGKGVPECPNPELASLTHGHYCIDNICYMLNC